MTTSRESKVESRRPETDLQPATCNLQLDRPLVVFDIEATGTDVVQDRTITLAAMRIDAGLFDATEIRTWMVNPGFPIPPESTRIHGITDAMVADKPAFTAVAGEIHQFFGSADLCGYNLLKFDVPMLWEEFCRAGIDWDLDGVRIIDASEIFRKKEPRTLTAALKKYCSEEHAGAHDALADVIATWNVLNGQRRVYEDLGVMNVAGLAEFSGAEEWEGRPARRLDLAGYLIEDADGVARYTLKKVRGVPVLADPGFGEWMLRNNFPEHTKRALRQALDSDDLPM